MLLLLTDFLKKYFCVTSIFITLFFIKKMGKMVDSSNEDEKIEGFQWILDKLPIGISVQTPSREILYENETVKELLGSYLNRQCYIRWHYLPGRGDTPCPECPATVGMQDNIGHKVFRKTTDEKGDDLYLEIEFIPVTDSEGKLEKFIEIIRNVTLQEKAKVLATKSIDEIVNGIQVSIVKYGALGGEIITTDQLDFEKSENLEEILTKITVYIFSGVFQGYENQKGFFGPFPVLDKINYLLEVFVCRIKDEEEIDLRFEGMQLCMILLFFPRDYVFLFEERIQIENFISEKINEWKSIQNITQESHDNFAADLKQFIAKLV